VGKCHVLFFYQDSTEGEMSDENDPFWDPSSSNGPEDSSIELDTLQSSQPPSWKRRYTGHCSVATIKGVNFYGPCSEYIMTGSDDSRIFIWDKKTSQIVNVLEGHRSIVNCVVSHPFQPLIASSGIDHTIKFWQNVGNYSQTDQETKSRRLQKIIQRNQTSSVLLLD